MAWTVKFERHAERELSTLNLQIAQRILDFLHQRVAALDDPRSIGKALNGAKLGTLWRYCYGDYRVIASIEDAEHCVLVVRIGHRRKVYR